MKTIVVYTQRINGSYDGLFLSLEREGRRRGWRFVWLSAGDGAPGEEQARLDRLFALVRPVGFIGGYVKGSPVQVPPGIPQVWLDSGIAPRGAALVRHDNARFGEVAARALLGGGTDAYAAFGLARHRWSAARVRAFAARIRSEGARCRAFRLPHGVLNSPYSAFESIREDLRKLPRPVSVFAVTDRLADVVLMAATSLGWRCPEDFRLVGVDDDEVVCLSSPIPISSVRPDWAEGGRLVAEVLELQMRGGRARREYVYGVAGVTRRATTRESYRRPVDERVRLGLDFIDAEFDSPIGLADVVAAMGCSKRLAQLRFREETGKTISAAILERRLARAEVLLRRMHPDFSTLPAMCGFRTMAALRAAFKAFRGVSMTEWHRRERHEPLS